MKKCDNCIVSIGPMKSNKLSVEFELHHCYTDVGLMCSYCPECGHKVKENDMNEVIESTSTS
jgi:hypothetical protein